MLGLASFTALDESLRENDSQKMNKDEREMHPATGNHTALKLFRVYEHACMYAPDFSVLFETDTKAEKNHPCPDDYKKIE